MSILSIRFVQRALRLFHLLVYAFGRLLPCKTLKGAVGDDKNWEGRKGDAGARDQLPDEPHQTVRTWESKPLGTLDPTFKFLGR
jgi:hypothetical protein